MVFMTFGGLTIPRIGPLLSIPTLIWLTLALTIFLEIFPLYICFLALALHCSWSDHAPVTLSLDSCHWQLNKNLIKNPAYREELVRNSVSSYFHFNTGSVSSISSLWEVQKAVLWGKPIAFGSCLKRNAVEQNLVLRGHLRQLEVTMFSRPTIRTLGDLVEVCSRLKELAMRGVEKLLLYSKQKYYEFGNRAHTFLAKRLKDSGQCCSPACEKGRWCSYLWPESHVSHFSRFLLQTILPTDQ